MKLKTLLLVVAILCVSLFVVACGEDETTTAGENPDGTTAAATTTKATTKKTTKETTTKVTTTTVTTTLDPNYKNLLPAKLPDNSTFDIHTRVGLDAEADYLGFTGEKYADLTWPTSGGIYGGCISFSTNKAYNNGAGNRAEGTLALLDPFMPEGVKGVLWYVDASNLTANGSGGSQPIPAGQVAFSVTINGNNYRSTKNGVGTAKGWYYKDGVWTETSNANAGRMAVPEKFKGWMYVPLKEYWSNSGKNDATGDLYDANGIGLGNVIVEKFNLYTEGYDYLTAGAIIWDEILFVK